MKIVIFIIAVLTVVLAQSAIACDSKLDAEFDAKIDSDNPDQQRFDRAVRELINYERCREGLAPLVSSPALLRAAAGHAGDMARLGFMSHESPVSGKARFTDRIKREGVRYNEAGENISQRNVYAFERQKFVIENAADCQFTFLGSGAAVPRHSYKSLAQSVVKGWMASTPHRLNILTKGFRKTGTGMAIDHTAPYCGDILIAQTFSD